MDKITKISIIIGPVMTAIVFAATSPTIHLYFMQLVSIEVLSIADTLQIALAAIVNSTIPNDKAKELYRRHFYDIVVVDVVCYSAISYGSLLDTTIRFIGLAIVNSVSTVLWCTILKNAINRVLQGDKLTDWNSFSASLTLYGALLGGAIAILNTNMDVQYCLFAQCFISAFMGATDSYAFKRLKRIYDKQQKEKSGV